MTYTWPAIAHVLSDHDAAASTCLRVEKDAVPHPVHGGLLTTIRVPRGQLADYRLPIDANTWLLVSEFSDRYEVTRQVRAPASHVPSATDRSGVLLGLFVGLLLGGTIAAALTGATVGAAVEAGTAHTGGADEQRKRRLRRLRGRARARLATGGATSC